MLDQSVPDRVCIRSIHSPILSAAAPSESFDGLLDRVEPSVERNETEPDAFVECFEGVLRVMHGGFQGTFSNRRGKA
jgi:hypothetical protein